MVGAVELCGEKVQFDKDRTAVINFIKKIKGTYSTSCGPILVSLDEYCRYSDNFILGVEFLKKQARDFNLAIYLDSDYDITRYAYVYRNILNLEDSYSTQWDLKTTYYNYKLKKDSRGKLKSLKFTQRRGFIFGKKVKSLNCEIKKKIKK